MAETANYGLYVSSDSQTKFPDWRKKVAGETNSNMVKIDSVLKEHEDAIGAMDRFFISVSDGKSMIASAITDKGIATAADASFQTMKENILAIESGGGLPEGVYQISVSASTAEGGTVSGGGVASEGMTLTVSANVADGYDFVGWRENGEVVSTDNPYTFTVTGNRALTAAFAFAATMYTVTATIDPAGAGAVTGAGQYQEGATATITATPAEGYTFSGWAENGATVSTDESYTFTVTGNRAFVAVFAEKISRLPEGYTELAYISNPNLGYIRDLGLPKSWGTYKWEMDIETTAYLNGILLGNSVSKYVSSTLTYVDNYLANFTYGIFNACFGSGKAGSINSGSPGRKKIIVEFPSKTFAVNDDSDILSSSISTVDSSSLTSALFARNRKTVSRSGNVTNEYGNSPTNFKLFSLKLTASSGDIYLEYVPCTNPAGIAGVYELVTGKFYSSYDSSKPFEAGPAV